MQSLNFWVNSYGIESKGIMTSEKWRLLFYYPQVNTDLPGKSSFHNFLPVTIILKKFKKQVLAYQRWSWIIANVGWHENGVVYNSAPFFLVDVFARLTDWWCLFFSWSSITISQVVTSNWWSSNSTWLSRGANVEKRRLLANWFNIFCWST